MMITLTIRFTLMAAYFLCTGAVFALTIETVPVGSPNNPTGTIGEGKVSYRYRIGKYEVTNSQYVEFLNSVAASDPHMLFHPMMTTDTRGGIVRSGTPGNFTYSVKSPAAGKGLGGSDYRYENKPVVFVSWYDALRFTNWLHNGQGNSSTNTGAYSLGDSVEFTEDIVLPENYDSVSRNASARWFLPNPDEWTKAAIYDPTSGAYYDYPTGANDVPNNNSPTNDSGNSANFLTGDYFTSPHYATGNADFPITDVGAYALSASPFGTFDQLGNATEWVERYELFSAGSIHGGLLGASWIVSIDYNGPIPCCWFADDTAWFELNHVGFRVATIVPEPTGLAYWLSAIVVGLGCSIRGSIKVARAKRYACSAWYTRDILGRRPEPSTVGVSW